MEADPQVKKLFLDLEDAYKDGSITKLIIRFGATTLIAF